MTDLAQKIAAMLVDKGYVMPHEQYEAAHAIRTALPVAQGEAVGYYWYDVAGERQFDWVKPDEWTQRTCAVMPVYESPPASRIAELEREVERLREALGVMLKGNEMGEVECQRTGFPRMITRHEMARKALAQEKK